MQTAAAGRYLISSMVQASCKFKSINLGTKGLNYFWDARWEVKERFTYNQLQTQPNGSQSQQTYRGLSSSTSLTCIKRLGIKCHNKQISSFNSANTCSNVVIPNTSNIITVPQAGLNAKLARNMYALHLSSFTSKNKLAFTLLMKKKSIALLLVLLVTCNIIFH